ncbi:hypothetical protein JVU11DRAFT_9231 [Chiua virens]|nr:hypothetical protein JVU11DRAFT_9231 [Chiua virens]
MSNGSPYGRFHRDPRVVCNGPVHRDLLDVLFLKKLWWYQYVKDDDLDRSFGLAGAAIGASLREFSEGTFREHSVAAENWRYDFVEVMGVVRRMRADEVPGRCAQLTELHHQIVVKGKSLRPIAD